MSVIVLILGALERFGMCVAVIFEIGGKYRGLGFVKQLIGEKAMRKEKIGSSWINLVSESYKYKVAKMAVLIIGKQA